MNERGRTLENSIKSFEKDDTLEYRKDYFTYTSDLLYYMETTDNDSVEINRKVLNTLRKIERSKKYSSRNSTTVSWC